MKLCFSFSFWVAVARCRRSTEKVVILGACGVELQFGYVADGPAEANKKLKLLTWATKA